MKAVGEQDNRIPKPCSRALFSTAAGFCGKARRSAPRGNKSTKNEKNNRSIRRGPSCVLAPETNFESYSFEESVSNDVLNQGIFDVLLCEMI